jgi:hypothetical protein
MSADAASAERQFLRRWTLATFVGWLLGFVFTMGAAIVADIMGVEDVQFFVALGMGTGVGYGQLRVVRPRLGAGSGWVGASALGMAAPFVVVDALRAVSGAFPFSLPITVALGGLAVGLLQRPTVRMHSSKANWWVIASLVGWVLAAATVGLSGLAPHGGWLALISLGAILGAGVILAVVTGGALVWLLRYPPPVSLA